MSCPASPGFAGLRILLVEENQELADLVLSLLARASLRAEHATNPRSGMELFQMQTPHLVLLGLGLPQIGGAAMCGPIRVNSNVPIIILSVRTRREDHFHVLNMGADDFITMRPPDETLIMTRILTLLRRVYQYDSQPIGATLQPPTIQPPQSQLPSDWVTCEACGYMGPNHRFEKRDNLGQKVLSCPHCSRQQNLRFAIT